MDNRKKPDQPTEEGRNPRYHVYVRLPFNRGDFVDPGPVSFALCLSRDNVNLPIKGELGRKEV